MEKSDIAMCTVHSRQLYYKCSCGTFICEECNVGEHEAHKDKSSFFMVTENLKRKCTKNLEILESVTKFDKAETTKMIAFCIKSKGKIYDKMYESLKNYVFEQQNQIRRKIDFLMLDIQRIIDNFIRINNRYMNKIFTAKQECQSVLKRLECYKEPITKDYIGFIKNYKEIIIGELIEFQTNGYYNKTFLELEKMVENARNEVKKIEITPKNCEQLWKTYEDSRKLNEALNAKNAEISDKNKKLEKEGLEISVQNEKAKNIGKMLNESNKRLENEKESLKKEIEIANAEILEKRKLLEKEGQEISAQNQKASDARKILTEENKLIENENEKLKVKNKELKNEANKTEEILKRMHDELKNLNEQKGKLTNENIELNINKADAKSAIEKLEIEKKVLEDTINKSKKQIFEEEKKSISEYENVLYSFNYDDGKCYLYDIVTKERNATLFEENKDVKWGGSCKIKDKIYFAGGFNYKLKKYLQECMEYIILKDLRMQRKGLDSLNNPVYCNTLVNLNNNIIFSIGGFVNDKCVNYCEKYEIAKNKWSQSKSLNEAKHLVTAIALESRYIYCIGGSNSKGINFEIERLDTQTENNWEIIQFTNYHKEYLNDGWHYQPAVKINENEFIIFGDTANININFSTQTCTTLIQYKLVEENDNQNELIYKDNKIYRIFSFYKTLECFNIKTNKYEEETPIKF